MVDANEERESFNVVEEVSDRGATLAARMRGGVRFRLNRKGRLRFRGGAVFQLRED
jgi:hypothetical protein